jgi:hypothetical protein
MSHNGTKPLSQIKTFLTRLPNRADKSICADQDEWAHRLGWTVTRTGFGARRYRDPRFDGLRAERAQAPSAPIGPVPAGNLRGR